VSAIPVGFPHDFISSTREFVYGDAASSSTDAEESRDPIAAHRDGRAR